MMPCMWPGTWSEIPDWSQAGVPVRWQSLGPSIPMQMVHRYSPNRLPYKESCILSLPDTCSESGAACSGDLRWQMGMGSSSCSL